MGSAAVREVTIIIPTYNRPRILTETYLNLRENLKFDGEIKILIGHDGEGAPFDGPDDVVIRGITVYGGPKKGLGANLNMLLSKVETPVVMQMDDDHWLVKPLDITQYYDDLMHPQSRNGWIRLFLGEKKDYYGNQASYYRFSASNVGPYWYLKPRLRELYIPSNRPHIKRVDFHDMYGFYKEDAKLGNTEEAFCHQFENLFMEIENNLWVTIPMFGLDWDQWQHVGDSWQKEGL